MFEIRTDLALETRELYQEKNKGEIPGIKVEKEEEGEVIITRVEILNEEGQKIMNRPIGRYITLESRALRKPDADLKDDISQLLAKELKKIVKIHKNLKVLVVGLGNEYVTPDSLGPKVVSKLFVTRHFFQLYNKDSDEGLIELSAISPGVMGVTGIETGEIVKGIIEKIKPDLVIAVDALASRKMERVNTTIQISTDGIHPGSGVGNKRQTLDKEALGIPVIAIGVPTVVDAATLTNDTIQMVISAFSKQSRPGSEFYKMLGQLNNEEKYELIREVLEPYGANVIVTPNNVDDIILNLSHIISNGINMALHPGIDLKDVNRYLH